MVIDFNAANGANSSGRSAQAGSAVGKRDAVQESTKTPEQTAGSKSQAAADASVRLSDQAQQLQAIEERLRELPDVDSERVAKLRQAIADGSYQADSSRIADKLLALED